MVRNATARPVTKVTGDDRRRARDSVAVEEPLEIRIGGEPFSVTMRTPGDDFDLVAGFLVSEGVVHRTDDLPQMRVVAGVGMDGEPVFNVVDATVLGPGVAAARLRSRSTYVTSACGVCGLASIDAVRTTTAFPLLDAGFTVASSVLGSLPDRLRTEQRLFGETGGVHAAALFDVDGAALCVREDVGRHNAVDKVVGWALRQARLPLSRTVLQVSGRASFELVQKALMAGIPVLAAVSAPSSLAVDLAVRSGLTLAGFSRGGAFNLYAGGHRVG